MLTRKLQKNIEGIKEALNGNLLPVMDKALNIALNDNINVHKQAMSKLMRGDINDNKK